MERKSFSHRTIFVALGVSLLLGLITAFVIFDRLVTYTPHAVLRVPDGAGFVARLNVEQAVVRAPLAEFVLPLFERDRVGPEPRKKHLERRTTIELDVDVRELVYADLPSDQWVLIAAGHLRKDDVVDGVGRMLTDEKIPFERRGDLLVHPSGIAFGVASDGALVLGSGDEAVRLTLEKQGAQAPSWATRLQGRGVAFGIYRGREPAEQQTAAPLRGTFVVQGESYFPVEAAIQAPGDDGTEAEMQALLASKANDFSYLVPLSGLKVRGQMGAEIHAQGNLGRPKFDETVKRFSQHVAAALDRSLSQAAHR